METCSECGTSIEHDGIDDMGFCEPCLVAWWAHADSEHECSWGCVASFRDYAVA